MNIMTLIYHAMVAYLAVHLVVLLFRERKVWQQVSVALVLVLFLLRVVLVQ